MDETCDVPMFCPPTSVNGGLNPRPFRGKSRRGLSARLCSYLRTMRLILRWALLLLPNHTGRTATSLSSLRPQHPYAPSSLRFHSLHSTADIKGIMVSIILLEPSADMSTPH